MIDTLVLETTGIVVSGVVGPLVVTLAVRRHGRSRVIEERGDRRREELRDALEEAGRLLGASALGVRVAAAAHGAGGSEPPELTQWAERIYLVEQGLLLRLEPDDPIIASLDSALEVLADLDAARTGTLAYASLAERFDAAQRRFLDVSRAALETRTFL